MRENKSSFYIKEDEIPIIYEKGERKAVILEYERFKKLIERLEERGKRQMQEDHLSKVIGICEGPVDLARNHDKYIYGK